MFAVSSRRVLPGFNLSLGNSLLFVCLILLLPLSALVMQLAQMSWAQYWEVITNQQVVAAYKVTLLSAFAGQLCTVAEHDQQDNAGQNAQHCDYLRNFDRKDRDIEAVCPEGLNKEPAHTVPN